MSGVKSRVLCRSSSVLFRTRGALESKSCHSLADWCKNCSEGDESMKLWVDVRHNMLNSFRGYVIGKCTYLRDSC